MLKCNDLRKFSAEQVYGSHLMLKSLDVLPTLSGQCAETVKLDPACMVICFMA